MMLDQQKFRDIIRGLLAKSQANEVNWRQDFNRQGQRTFFVVFPSSAQIRVTFGSPESEPDYVQAALVSKQGEVLFSVALTDSEDEYQLVRDLYDEAYRSVTGWDAVVSDIEDQLKRDGRVGAPAPDTNLF